MTDFDRAFALILIYEGGYVDDPDDAGGQTKYGISKAAHPDVDVENLTLDGAKAIYRKHYWERYRCGELPWPLAFTLFDCVVQFNPANPIRWLQSAVGAAVDGVLGPQTVAAARACREPATAACKMMINRGEYRTSHPKYRKFGKGWRARDLMVMCEAARERGAS